MPAREVLLCRGLAGGDKTHPFIEQGSRVQTRQRGGSHIE
jgi:hypothetical protein